MIVTDAGWNAVDAAAFCARWMAGRVGERPVSDQQRADERCCSVRRSRVVLTPRCWCQVRGVKSAQPGLDKNISVGDGGKRARSPGRARRKPLKPLRAGTSGDSGVLVYSCAFYQYKVHTRPRVQRAPGVPHALYFKGGTFLAKSRACRAAGCSCVSVTGRVSAMTVCQPLDASCLARI